MLAEAVVTLGLLASSGLGELAPAPSAGVRIMSRSRDVRLVLRWDGADKIESGAGWTLAADADVGVWRGLYVGAGYHHRDGGPWVKRSAWLRAGWAHRRRAELSIARDMSTANRVLRLEGSGRIESGRLSLRSTVGVASYLDGHGERRAGVLAQAELGWRIR
mgnify:CR=1 FL=1